MASAKCTRITDWKTEKITDRQGDRQTLTRRYCQTDRLTDRLKERQTDTDRKTAWHQQNILALHTDTNRQTDWQILIDIQTDIDRTSDSDRETDKPTAWQNMLVLQNERQREWQTNKLHYILEPFLIQWILIGFEAILERYLLTLFWCWYEKSNKAFSSSVLAVTGFTSNLRIINNI